MNKKTAMIPNYSTGIVKYEYIVKSCRTNGKKMQVWAMKQKEEHWILMLHENVNTTVLLENIKFGCSAGGLINRQAI